MTTNLLHLKILLPFKVLLDEEQVIRLVAETSKGLFGILPQRLDCVAAMVPGILTYETNKGIKYVAIDEGILVKAGQQVFVSVRNGFAGVELGKLKEQVERQFKNLDENEKNARTSVAKLESGFIRNFNKLMRQ